MAGNAPPGADYDPRAPWYDEDRNGEPIDYEPEYDPDEDFNDDDENDQEDGK